VRFGAWVPALSLLIVLAAAAAWTAGRRRNPPAPQRPGPARGTAAIAGPRRRRRS